MSEAISSVNNGVNVDALIAAREALTKAPEAAQFKTCSNAATLDQVDRHIDISTQGLRVSANLVRFVHQTLCGSACVADLRGRAQLWGCLFEDDAGGRGPQNWSVLP